MIHTVVLQLLVLVSMSSSFSSAFIISTERNQNNIPFTTKSNIWTKKTLYHKTAPSQQGIIPTRTTSLNLFNDFITDNFFAVNGLITGFFLTSATGASRIVSANEGWEERLRAAKEEEYLEDDEDEDNAVFTELDIRSEIAEKSPSKYGPKSEGGTTRNQSESTDQINVELEFETSYGIPYEPYYDVPYEEEELPTDVGYSKDPFFGDRVYENGEQFFSVGKGMYYRKGSRPRMKFIWE